MAEVINKWYEKQWRLITADSIDGIRQRIDDGILDMDAKCKDALSRVMEGFGGSSEFKVLKRRGEHGIHGDDYLDKLPADLIIHDTVFKKVYDKKVEFYDPANVKNYVSNRAIEDISPEIADEMKSTRELVEGILEVNASTSRVINTFVTKFLPIQADFAVNVRSHTAVIKNMVTATKKLNRLLSTRQTRIGDYSL